MTRTRYILACIAREERKREARAIKPSQPRKPRPKKRIRFDRPLPHEARP